MPKRGVIGVSFDHMHMGDLLRQVAAHPEAEIAAIWDPDPARMAGAAAALAIPPERVFTDLDACLDATEAELAILCAAPAEHASLAARLFAAGLNVLVEKPFAMSAGEARRMMAAAEAAGRRLAVNWPAAWSPGVLEAKRLVAAGALGALTEVRHTGGNRGPLFHLADKVEVAPEEVDALRPGAWWYARARGGGSLRDYLGYGATLGTWLRDGEAPLEVTCVTRGAPDLEVDEQSVTICRHATGLSVFETRWDALSDPWVQQPQPKCGFVLVGTEGSLSAYDYDGFVTLQTRAEPAPRRLPAATRPRPDGPVDYMLARLADGGPIEGPLDPAVSLIGQRIIDSALRSAERGRTVPLAP